MQRARRIRVLIQQRVWSLCRRTELLSWDMARALDYVHVVSAEINSIIKTNWKGPLEERDILHHLTRTRSCPFSELMGQLRGQVARDFLQMLGFRIFCKFTNHCFSVVWSSWQGLYSSQNYFPWAICLENRDLPGFPHSLLPQSVCLPLSSFDF